MGCPPGDADPRKPFYERRWACYRLCVGSLSTFDDQLADAIKKGEPGLEQDAARTRAYQLAFESQDQAFHSFFYDWLIDRGMTEELLEVCTTWSHWEARAYNSSSIDRCSWKITCRESRGPSTSLTFCGNTMSKPTNRFARRRFLRISRNLSSKFSDHLKDPLPLTFLCRFNLTLDRRIEYLTLAVNNAKSHPSSEFGRHETAVEFLTDLEEKLEVAQVQREICHSLTAKLGAPSGEDTLRLRYLQNTLLNITQVGLLSVVVISTNALRLAVRRLCRSLRVTCFQASHLQSIGPSGSPSYTCNMGSRDCGKYVP